MKVLLTINAGAHNITLRPCDDAGTPIAPIQYINFNTNTVVEAVYAQNQYFDWTRFNQWGAYPVGNNPGEYPAMPNFLPLTPTWKVRIFTSGNMTEFVDVVLPLVYSAPYANTATGANAAVAAISAAIP